VNRIREATPEDLPAMRAAKQDAGQAAWSHILSAEVLVGLGFPERWEAAIADPDPRVAVLVTELDGGVAGFAVIRPSGDTDAIPLTGELDAFYAAPWAWGRGAGQALLQAATMRLAEAGFRDATLWTATENHRPRRIYEAAGWRLDGTEREREIGGSRFSEVRYRRGLVRPSRLWSCPGGWPT
jgi:L-amino acid N-acyltransferase YncA